jgi:hypothetical protein
MDEMDSELIVRGESAGAGPGQPPVESAEGPLLTRFLLGILLLGSDELQARLRALQGEIEAGSSAVVGDVVSEDETTENLLGYLALGMFVRGQKRLARRVRRGIRFSKSTAGWALGTLNRLTDNPLGRPFRRPVERRIWNLVQEGELAINEGQREVVASRVLATRALDETIDEVVQILAENPELTAALQRIVAGQGVSLAGTVVGNAQQLGVSADDLAEGMVRRLLRRKRRWELPPSPLAGQPLTMYAPQRPDQGAEDDDQ